MQADTELLTGVSIDELEALAAGVLVPRAQTRLDQLIADAKQHPLASNDAAELDDLLNKVDQLTLLKARARYTLDRVGAKTSET